MTEQEVQAASRKRTLELEAFSSLVDALRAAGPLSHERKTVLQQTAASLRISPDRYKAEIRRALSRTSLGGDVNDEASWAMEGRRDTFLLPRKALRATMAAPYSAYSCQGKPVLIDLPKAPYKNAETQTVMLKPATNSKLVVVSSPRSQTTHTMVYAKSGHKQIRVSPQVTSSGSTTGVPVVINAKGQPTTKVITMPPAMVKATVAVPKTLPVQQKLQAFTKGAAGAKPGQIIVTTPNHMLNSPSANKSSQILITTPNNIVHKINSRTVTQTVQIKPTVGTPMVTKAVNPRTDKMSMTGQKARITQLKPTPPGAIQHLGLRLTRPSSAHSETQILTNGKAHPVKVDMDRLDGQRGEVVKPSKIIKSVSQWNYDDHSVMAKPAVVAPHLVGESRETKVQNNSAQIQQVVQMQNNHQTKTVQIVQMSTANAQMVKMGGMQARTPKPVRMVTPTQFVRKDNRVSSNVVVQSLPYHDCLFKLGGGSPDIHDDVIMEEEVS